jgi:hypothetical protein
VAINGYLPSEIGFIDLFGGTRQEGGNLDSLSINDFFNAQRGRTTGLQNL